MVLLYFLVLTDECSDEGIVMIIATCGTYKYLLVYGGSCWPLISGVPLTSVVPLISVVPILPLCLCGWGIRRWPNALQDAARGSLRLRLPLFTSSLPR
jgi:hypothetical protein